DVGFWERKSCARPEHYRFWTPTGHSAHTPRDGNVVSSSHCMNDPQPEGHMASHIGLHRVDAGARPTAPRVASCQSASIPLAAPWRRELGLGNCDTSVLARTRPLCSPHSI